MMKCLSWWLSGASGGPLNNWHQSEGLFLKLCHCQRPRGTVNSTQSKGKIRSHSPTFFSPPSCSSGPFEATKTSRAETHAHLSPISTHHLPKSNPNITCESVSWLVQLSKLFQGGSFPSSKATHFDSPGKDTFQPTATGNPGNPSRHSMIPSHSPHLTVSPPGSTAEAWDRKKPEISRVVINVPLWLNEKTWKSFCNRLVLLTTTSQILLEKRKKTGRGWNLNPHEWCCKKMTAICQSTSNIPSMPWCSHTPSLKIKKRTPRVQNIISPAIDLFVHHKMNKKQSPLRNERSKRPSIGLS